MVVIAETVSQFKTELAKVSAHSILQDPSLLIPPLIFA